MHYFSMPSPVGTLTVFEHGGAVVAVEWGKTENGKLTDLLREARRQLKAYFAGKLSTFDLPLDPDGSDFQRAVWREMNSVPYGETRTYGDIADAIGNCARAVGGACGRNPIPIIQPCHRIVGAGSAMTGFSGAGGIPTKEWLLHLEGWSPPEPAQMTLKLD